MTRDSFKVIIAGGGIAGLTLASILDRLHIDYVLLEAYSEIAPVIGASIALSAQSLRILDQIGCYDALVNTCPEKLNSFAIRVKSEALLSVSGLQDQGEKRHGYGVWFYDRACLLSVLYDNILNKDKVLLRKRVTEIDSRSNGVVVRTKDGSEYHGDIVVGADGIHSVVRQEMWRLSQHETPRLFPENEFKDVLITYRCMFGVSTLKKEISNSVLNYTGNDGYSYLTVHYTNGTHYWFVFDKLDEPFTHAESRRYTDQDIQGLANKLRHDSIADNLTFGDVFESSVTTGMVPVQESVFKRWHYKRLVTIGDSTHKFNPITGRGGNCAIEGAAMLSNELFRVLENNKALPSDEEITQAFARMQSLRQDHVTKLLLAAAKKQRVDARQSKLLTFLLPVLLKTMSRDSLQEEASAVSLEGPRIEVLPVLRRTHFLPFRDEYPATRFGKAASAIATSLAAFGFVGLGYYARKLYRPENAPASILSLLRKALRPLTPDFETVSTAARQVPVAKSFSAYAMVTVASAMAMWALEKYRRGNRQAPLGLLVRAPSVFATALSIYGAKVVVPAYYLITLLKNTNPIAQRTTARPVDPIAVKTILPALGTSMAAASAVGLFVSKYAGIETFESWRLAALIVAPLSSLIYAKLKSPQPFDDTALRDMNNDDLSAVKNVYAIVSFANAAVHASLISLPVLLNSRSMASTLELFTSNPDLLALGSGISLWTLYTVLDMRRLGYVTTKDAMTAGLASVLSLPLFGPVAMYSAVSRWRESCIARLVVE